MQMRFTYPKMKSPSIYTAHVDSQGVVLVYRSTRQGFTHYLMGKNCSFRSSHIFGTSLLKSFIALNEGHISQNYLVMFK